MRMLGLSVLLAVACGSPQGTSSSATYDVVIRGGSIVDGTGGAPFRADLAIRGDRIAAIGQLRNAHGKIELDARGLVVAPGFVNMLSWSNESLLVDGHAQSAVRQGVTTEIMGEGSSMGPLNDTMKRRQRERQTDIKYDIEWTTLGEYLALLERRGVSVNVASFVGAATVRTHVLGETNEQPTSAQLDQMRALVKSAMGEGALGLGSALIYTPGSFATTDELVALATEAAASGGMYTSHVRGEGAALLPALEEAITIAKRAGVRTEIHHLKAAGQQYWKDFDPALAAIEKARADGLPVTANIYLYPAAGTGLTVVFPTWLLEGGIEATIERLRDPVVRARAATEITTSEWWSGTGPDRMQLVGFKSVTLKPLTGKRLSEVATARGKSAVETAMDLVVEDGSRIDTIFFAMSEDNVRKAVTKPWVAFGSDEAAMAPQGAFLLSNPHPRAYGNFARLLGHYVREQKLVTLAEAVRRLTSLPATNLRLDSRGRLAAGMFADIVVFDPATIRDHATFEQPHQYATGVTHVLVNGALVIHTGAHTGATPGRFLRGPGALHR